MFIREQTKEYEKLVKRGQYSKAKKIKLAKPNQQKTLQIFYYEIQLKKESMRHLMSIQDAQEFQNEYQVWDPKLKDMVFLKFGIEKDEYNNAANCHKLMEMEEVQAKMQEIEDMMDQDPNFRERAMMAL